MREGQETPVSSQSDEHKHTITSGKQNNSPFKSRRLQVLVVTVLFGAVGIFMLVQSFAADPSTVSNTDTDKTLKKVERYSMRLMALAKAAEKSQGNATTEAADVAQARKEALLDLMATDPQTAAKYMLPESSKSKLGSDAQSRIETIRELKGKLEVYIGESVDEKTGQFKDHFYDYYVVEPSGKKTKVYFKKSQEGLASKTIRFTAAVVGDSAVPMESGSPTVLAADTLTPAMQKTVAVLVVNFATDTRQPFTADQINTTYFGDATLTAKNYLASSTYNKIGVSGDVFGYYTIQDDPTMSCNYSAWGNSARAEAAKAGVDLSKYTNVAVWWPQQSVCTWAGLGQVSGGQTWINGYNTLRVTAHELTHNFGSMHASAMQCTENGAFVALPSDLTNCTVTEYGDPYSIMGGSSYYELTNISRQNLNALSAGNVKDATASGTFQLQPVEINNASGVNMLRIPRDTAGNYLTIEFRQTGFGNPYDTFPATSAVSNGIVFRLATSPTSARSSRLIDFNPASASYSDSPLPVGATFKDPITGVAVTLDSISDLNTASALANVKVVYPPQGPICSRNAPSVSVTPLSQWGTPGQALSYTATITNNDTGCPETTFDLAATLPNAFKWTPSVQSVKLLPSASATVPFTVSSDTTTGAGYYSVAVGAINNGDTTKRSFTSVNYNIAATTDTTAPVATISAPTNGSTVGKKATTVQARATDNVGVTSMELYVDGKLTTSVSGATLSYSLNTAKFTRGTHTLTVKAYDASGNMGLSSVTITK